MRDKKLPIETKSFLETQKISGILAQEILSSIQKQKKAQVIVLSGDLGAGKTVFVQGFAKKLKIKQKITSPTFVIFKKYKFKQSVNNFGWLYHFDCYRLKDEKDVLSLGFEEFLKEKNAIIMIEWPEKIKKVLPKNSLFEA